jgi:urease accessory protein
MDDSQIVLVREPLGNLATFAVGDRTLERVRIESDDLAKRLLRLRCERVDIGIRLADDTRLRDGDIVFVDASHVVAVCVDADDVLVCRPQSIAQALAVAHALGNRHLPMQIDGDALVVRYDRLVAALLAELGAPFAREARTLSVPFRHAHAPHAHA